MAQIYDILEFTKEMPVKCTIQKIGHIPSHIHSFFELCMILNGDCHFVLGNQTFLLKSEDIVAINAHTPHEFHSTNCIIISVKFEQRIFEENLPTKTIPGFFCNSSIQGETAAFHELRKLISQLIKNNNEKSKGFELRNWSIVYQIMDIFYCYFQIDTEQDKQLPRRYATRMSEITSIINKHYKEPLTLSELAEKVYLSAPYLSKFFTKNFGMTFLAYLTQIRLNHALDSLTQTDDTIEMIAAESGFPNSHAFVQAFKKEFDVLPSVYRRKNKINPEKTENAILEITQHNYISVLKKYLEESEEQNFTFQNTRSETIRFSKNEVRSSLLHTWKNILSIGAARYLLISDIQELIRKVQTEIGFRHIRFYGIFSDEMYVYKESVSGEPVCNFTYIDKILDFLLSVHLRPFIQLSFMPKKLARFPDKYLFGELVSEPENIEKWCMIVSSFMKHIKERYGKEEVSMWLFSVWHLPDTSMKMYGFSSEDIFRTFYKNTWKVMKESIPGILVGLPPAYYLIEDNYENWFINFLDFCRQEYCMPDFLSFNYYETELNSSEKNGQKLFGFVHSMTLRETPGGVYDFIQCVRKDMKKTHTENLPVYLIEWNTSPSQQDLLNDTCYKSCYITKTLLENFDKLDGFGYMALSDLLGDDQIPEKIFFGGLGLFTTVGIPKASYFAFQMINRLGNLVLGNGDGWFATRSESQIQILLYNYRHFSHLYALGEKFDMTDTDRYTHFSPEQNLDMQIQISGMEKGNYEVRETILNRRHGSAFDTWVAMGGMPLREADEFDCLATNSTPFQHKYRTHTTDGTLGLEVLLDMLEVRLIVLTPISE